MRILITGASGQLGTELRHCLETGRAQVGPLPAVLHNAQVDCTDHTTLDITDEAAVRVWFEAHGPYDVVFNCSAYTNVDGCETHEAEAFAVNATGAGILAAATERCGGKYFYISTDYVFSGEDEHSRVEDDEPGPLSAYGRSKLEGERATLAACSRSFIVRTAWLYGQAGGNFVKTMLRLARQNGKISVVADQFGNPTNANDLAYELLCLSLTDDYGIYNCTGNGICSWYDFACAIVDIAGIPCEKEPLTSAEYKERFPQSCDRPHYSSLDNARLRATIGDDMRPWHEALVGFLEAHPEL